MSKKKRPPRRQTRNGREQSPPAMPDRRLMDQSMAGLMALLAGRDFASVEEMNAYLESVLKGGPPPPPPAETPLQKAQAVMYEAFEARGRQRIRLAQKALTISPDCADAYVLLAEEATRSLNEANEYYRQGMEAGRRALGPEIFRDGEGHFWGIVETRPFMRALYGYAQTLWWLRDQETSVTLQEELLRLNPGDNQGMRYFHIHCLLELDRLDELEQLFEAYPDDAAATYLYPRALAAYMKRGPSAKATRFLREAIETNPHVPAYLLGEKPVPRQLPEYHGFGDENEAILYAGRYGVFWPRVDGALDWLMEVSAGWEGDWDAVADEDEEDEEPFEFPPFRLADFLKEGGFPKSEYGPIRSCLTSGLARYIRDAYGYDKYGKRPTSLIDELMHLPYLYGYGAVEVIRHKRIRPLTKMTVCYRAFEVMRPTVEAGIPYGMLALVGWLAGHSYLNYDALVMATVGLGLGEAVQYNRLGWLEGAAKEEMLDLTDWIAANQEISAAEKLWWAWRLCAQSDGTPHLGKAIAGRWLSLDALSTGDKLALCRAWLDDAGEVGSPPLMWLVNKALLNNDVEELQRLIAQHNLELPPEVKNQLAELADESKEVEEAEEEDILLRLMSLRGWLTMPAFLHRLAIPALVRLGEDLETTIETYWSANKDYYESANTNGVADALREFGDRLPPERLRELIERGVTHSSALTRKTFYALALEHYGEEYLERALEDNAGSIRKWAAGNYRSLGGRG